MGVSNYIESYNKKRDDLIQKNIEYSNKHPYPIDELNELSDESAIKSVFDANGQIENTRYQAIQLAVSENRELFDRLYNGSNGLHKLKQNEELSSIDPIEELNVRYNALVSGLTGTDVKLEELLDSEDFEEVYDDIMDDSGIQGLDAGIDSIKLAFKELHENGGPDEEVNPLNPDEIIDEATDAEGPLNEGETTETSDDVEGEVTETDPALEVEATPNDNDTIDNVINDAEGPLNEGETIETSDDVEGEVTETDPALEVDATPSDNNTIDNVINDAVSDNAAESSPINSESGLPVYNENETEEAEPTVVESTPSIINDSQENNTNIENRVTETSSNDKSYLNNEESVTNVTNNSSSINTPSSPSSSGEGFDNGDMEAYTAEEIAMLTGETPTTGTSDAEESNGIINELTEGSSSTTDITDDISTTVNSARPGVDDAESIIDDVIGETEVTKENIGLDKSIAPLNTPTPESSDAVAPGVSEEIKMTEVKGENTKAEGLKSETTDNSQNVTNNETNKTESNKAGYSMTDMSQVEARLRKIENLLSSPLEVKIVE